MSFRDSIRQDVSVKASGTKNTAGKCKSQRTLDILESKAYAEEYKEVWDSDEDICLGFGALRDLNDRKRKGDN